MDGGGSRRLVLASASSARLTLLRSAGFDPEVIVSHVSEDGVDELSPAEAVRTLAERKAAAVAERLVEEPQTDSVPVIVGCDSLLAIDGVVRGKPSSSDEARAWWRDQRGRAGTLLTGHCVVDLVHVHSVTGVAETIVRFGDPTDAEIDAYLATGEPLEVAGAATIDGYGAPFIDGIDGDHGTVLGLSLPLLRRLLAELGIAITDLWTKQP